MSEMNAMLGEVFGTTKTAHTQEDLFSAANLEFFGALCKEAGIDTTKLSDDQVNEAFLAAVEHRKTASAPPFPPKKDEGKDKEKDEGKEKDKEAQAKLAAAEAEYAEKRAAAVKVAEADACGRIMAHAMFDELKKIAAEMPPQFQKSEGKDGEEKKDKDKDEGKEKESAAEKAAAMIRSFTQKTAGAGSSSPNLDEVAAYRAIDMLKEAGVDADEAFSRINAVYTLGLPESTKIAAATDFNVACHTRALEYCEAAKYPVNWGAE